MLCLSIDEELHSTMWWKNTTGTNQNGVTTFSMDPNILPKEVKKEVHPGYLEQFYTQYLDTEGQEETLKIIKIKCSAYNLYK